MVFFQTSLWSRWSTSRQAPAEPSSTFDDAGLRWTNWSNGSETGLHAGSEWFSNPAASLQTFASTVLVRCRSGREAAIRDQRADQKAKSLVRRVGRPLGDFLERRASEEIVTVSEEYLAPLLGQVPVIKIKPAKIANQVLIPFLVIYLVRP
jgi:hypothetical protein